MATYFNDSSSGKLVLSIGKSLRDMDLPCITTCLPHMCYLFCVSFNFVSPLCFFILELLCFLSVSFYVVFAFCVSFWVLRFVSFTSFSVSLHFGVRSPYGFILCFVFFCILCFSTFSVICSTFCLNLFCVYIILCCASMWTSQSLVMRVFGLWLWVLLCAQGSSPYDPLEKLMLYS
ncbi:hypothetical protein Dimus_003320 [Dionaea muscipula]